MHTINYVKRFIYFYIENGHKCAKFLAEIVTISVWTLKNIFTKHIFRNHTEFGHKTARNYAEIVTRNADPLTKMDENTQNKMRLKMVWQCLMKMSYSDQLEWDWLKIMNFPTQNPDWKWSQNFWSIFGNWDGNSVWKCVNFLNQVI